ncbi:wings apart-like protein regulation of heterochromatin-domain-containing protein [Bombardia bombarda]|uniref:Wings apart-like protein regulation of heterochromatin-domain-containing protein n=1 Tax=Bombardia bombarda TaxID=252184 RepID=A0AA39XK50_9PEZI|nr:wings apart-like protein regulation of heterochromatin-domain-containing protein [Bombardia bombarda]
MATNTDYDFPPQPRVMTYGRAGRRRAAQSTMLRTSKSEVTVATTVPPPLVATTSALSSLEPRPAARSTSSATGGRQYGQRAGGVVAQPRKLDEAQSQPTMDTIMTDSLGEDTRAKNRKLVRTCSEKKLKPAAAYSTPDSSPSEAHSPLHLTEKREAPPRSVPGLKPVSKTQRTPEKKVSARDMAPQQTMPFSAKTSRALDNLSVSLDQPEKTKHQIPLRLSRAQPSSFQTASKKRSSPPLSSSASTQEAATEAPRKKRLIDALVVQQEDDSSSDEELSSSQGTETRRSPGLDISSPPPASVFSKPRVVPRPVLATKKTGPKFTYSQSRTMLAEEDTLLSSSGLDGMDEDLSKGPMFSFGRLTKSSTVNTFSFVDEDDETVNSGAVRSIHELRQAGANNRFADEMDDILDRIGSPSAKPASLRRGALLELAQKIREKDFRRQFRNHSGDGGLFKALGQETDLISGYSIAAILATLLATSMSAHLLQQLRAYGFPELLTRLLKDTTDIALLAKDRKQNVSRNGQTTLAGIKASILELPIWEPISPPKSLSPRTLALKCLDLIMRQSTQVSDDTDIFTSAVTDQLFSILSDGASNQAVWNFPGPDESLDFYLTLYVLEGHSIHAMQSRLGSRWTSHYVPIVAGILETTLRRPADKLNDLESLSLRITLNVTNNNAEACGALVEKGLLRDLAEAACRAFDVVLNSMKVDSFLSNVHESLIMMLGVMINFCVYYPPASRSLQEKGDATGSALNRLIRVFADNHSKTSDADSMEKTRLNVALGYLSVLLGYLCLNSSIRERFAAVHHKKSLQPLLDSINEFIVFHHRVAEAQETESGIKQDSEFAALGRLQTLVHQLKAQCA